MRILAMTNLYPNPFQPQRATFNRHRLRILSEKFPVRVIAPIAWTDEWKAGRSGNPALPAGRRVQYDGLTVDHPRYLFPPKFGRAWYGHFYLKSVTRTFDRAVQEFKPTLLFAPWAYPDGWAAVRLGRRFGLPVVIQCHGSDVLLLDKFPARKHRTIDAVTEADGVVAVSKDISRNLQAMGVKPDRIRVIYDGVDLSKFQPAPKAEAREKLGLSGNEPTILFVGNLVPVKAIDVLLAACAQLVRVNLPFRLILIGEGLLRAKLEVQAEELGLKERVRFLGSVPHEQLPTWFQASDLFVLPSHSEGVPTVLLEASACRTPWVASRVGGIPEIERLGVSKLVMPNTPLELAAAIREQLTTPVPEDYRPPSRSAHAAVDELIGFFGEYHRTKSNTEQVRRAAGGSLPCLRFP